MANTQGKNGWTEWKKYVLKEIDTLCVRQTLLETKITELGTEITILKVKARLWGLIGGLLGGIIPGLVALILFLIGRVL